MSARDAKGQIICYDNTPGNAGGTTPHLHYQVSYRGGMWGSPMAVLPSYPEFYSSLISATRKMWRGEAP